MLSGAKLAKAVKRALMRPLTGTYYRVVEHAHLEGPPPGAPVGSAPQPLWAGGSAMHGARYTPVGGPEGLYLASDPLLALQEVDAIFMPPGMPPIPAPKNPHVTMSVSVSLTAVLDLTDATTITTLGSSVQELTGEWRYTMGTGGEPATHAIAKAAHRGGKVAALMVHSAKRTGTGVNLVVFPDRLASTRSYLQVISASGNLAQRLP